MRPAHIIIAGILGAAAIFGAEVPISSKSLTCDTTWKTDQFDTPSGLMENNYYNDIDPYYAKTATRTLKATVIGSLYQERCMDGKTSYICSLTQQDFDASFKNAQPMVQKTANTYAIAGTKCE